MFPVSLYPVCCCTRAHSSEAKLAWPAGAFASAVLWQFSVWHQAQQQLLEQTQRLRSQAPLQGAGATEQLCPMLAECLCLIHWSQSGKARSCCNEWWIKWEAEGNRLHSLWSHRETQEKVQAQTSAQYAERKQNQREFSVSGLSPFFSLSFCSGRDQQWFAQYKVKMNMWQIQTQHHLLFFPAQEFIYPGKTNETPITRILTPKLSFNGIGTVW